MSEKIIMPTGARKPLEPMAAVPTPLSSLLNEGLPRLPDEYVLLEGARQLAVRVDGTIIGTGEADFTKGNTLYTLKLDGKTFQLMDVPGIEGDEARYTDLVQQAVAKAHLVFYVNGTNKKPEVATVEKIKQYLKRGTQVYAIVNVRGSADAYEFDEDRQSLGKHGNADGALKQTMRTLSAAMASDVLLGGQCLHGLLAFSSLAVDARTSKTTIHPSRDRDLAVQQRNYRKYFGSTQAMQGFSQVAQLAEVLRSKQETFKDYIVESNKTKVKELLQENIAVLEAAHQSHQTFLEKLEPEFDKCREAVEDALTAFEGKNKAGRRLLWAEFFKEFSSLAQAIVEIHFGDDQIIRKKIDSKFDEGQQQLQKELQGKLEEYFEELQADLKQALLRLQQDVQRLDFQDRWNKKLSGKAATYQAPSLEMGLGLKGWGDVSLKVGAYAAAGATIGSAIPVIGTVIGSVIGALIGGVMSWVERLQGKESRIRKTQSQLQSKIDDMRAEAMADLTKGNKALAKMVQEEIGAKALAQVDALHDALRKPLPIIEHQIASMNHIQQRLEEMPHGTVQAI